MQLDKTAIKEFKQVYKEEFGVVLSDAEVTEKATSLLNLFKVLAENSGDLTQADERRLNEA